MSSNIKGWVRSTEKVINSLQYAYGDAVRDSAKLAKRDLTGAAKSMAGGDQRLSGVGKRGAKITVSYNVQGKDENTSALIKARGPWQLVEADTKPRDIPKRTKTGRISRSKKRLRLPDGGVRRSVSHPGTRGKGSYRAARRKLEPKVRKNIITAHSKALRKGLR